MAELLARRSLVLDSRVRNIIVPDLILPLRASKIQIRIARPTTLSPMSWGDADTMRIAAYLELDGVEEHAYTGRVTGGVRTHLRNGIPTELSEYILSFTPTWGYYDAVGANSLPKRLGERSTSFYKARLEISALSGVCDTNILINVEEAEAPRITRHNSVAFDAATDGSEVAGDGEVTVSHTPAGSTDLAAVVKCNSEAVTGQAGATTYNAVSMTELIDVIPASAGNWRMASYVLAGIPTGTSNVVNTIVNNSIGFQAVGVVSATGVHQTVPNGTLVSADASGSNASVTVLSVGSDDLVVGSLYEYDSITPTIGADQTLRCSEEYVGVVAWRVDTQPGSAGGVMTWTFSGVQLWTQCAVALKPSGAAATTHPGWRGPGFGWW